MLNRPMVQNVITQLREHPETHDQGDWARKGSCGTRHCVAGWVAAFSDVEIDWQPSTVYDGSYTAGSVFVGNEEESIDEYAQRVLGIDSHAADIIFFACDDTTEETLEKLEHLLEYGDMNEWPEEPEDE